MKVLEASGHVGRGLHAVLPVSCGFMASISFAVPQCSSTPRELAASHSAEPEGIIVIADESHQASPDSDSSGVVRRRGKLTRTHEAASVAASREVPPVERRLKPRQLKPSRMRMWVVCRHPRCHRPQPSIRLPSRYPVRPLWGGGVERSPKKVVAKTEPPFGRVTTKGSAARSVGDTPVG